MSWLVESGSDVKIGIADQSDVGSAQPVVVRIVIQQRTGNDAAWKAVWSADVVAHSEEVVTVRPTSPLTPELTVWAYALPDGTISVDSDLVLSRGETIRMTSSHLHVDREPVSVTSTRSDAVELRLLQAAAVLDADTT